MPTAAENDIGPTLHAVHRPARRSALTLPGLVVLAFGAALALAGCYRAAVLLSVGRIRPLVPIAVDAPLAAELLLLVAAIVLAAAALLLAAARRIRRP